MKEQLITVIIGLMATGITAVITYFFTNRSNQVKQREEIRKEQKYKYFLPFKDYSIEFLHRLEHIEQRIFENRLDMKVNFTQNYEGKNKDWFHIDWVDTENLTPGGYFITSTIYMNCILYSKIKLIQQEYPFIALSLKSNLKNLIKSSNNSQMKRCYNEVLANKQDYEHLWKKLSSLYACKKEIDIKQLIIAIRVSTIMKNGIPYSLHNSFGDYVMKDNKEINYNDFCNLLKDDSEILKFSSIIKFWTELFTSEGNIDERKLNRLRGLILILNLVENSDVK